MARHLSEIVKNYSNSWFREQAEAITNQICFVSITEGGLLNCTYEEPIILEKDYVMNHAIFAMYLCYINCCFASVVRIL